MEEGRLRRIERDLEDGPCDANAARALIDEVRRLQAACWYCLDWTEMIGGMGLGRGIALPDWLSLQGRLRKAVAGTTGDPGRRKPEPWPREEPRPPGTDGS